MVYLAIFRKGEFSWGVIQNVLWGSVSLLVDPFQPLGHPLVYVPMFYTSLILGHPWEHREAPLSAKQDSHCSKFRRRLSAYQAGFHQIVTGMNLKEDVCLVGVLTEIWHSAGKEKSCIVSAGLVWQRATPTEGSSFRLSRRLTTGFIGLPACPGDKKQKREILKSNFD